MALNFLRTSTSWPRASGPALPQPQRMLGCVVAGDAVKRRVEEQMEIWDVAPAMGGVQRRRGGADQRLRPPDTAGLRPLGGHDRRAPPRAGAGPARPLVVVMVGTAVTVEAIDAQGRFLGG
jgi:type III pantothenate kinase